MGLINTVRRWISMLFGKDIKEQFGVSEITSPEMANVISRCGDVYFGRPNWISEDVKTINFAKVIASETARLTTLAIGISFDDSARGKWLQSQFDKRMYFRLRHWIEYGNAFGTIVLKPSGNGIDMFLPGNFIITSTDGNGNIDGIVFRDTYQEGENYYTRLEYHRFEDGLYLITNRAFKSALEGDKGKPVPLESTDWRGLLDDVAIENVTDMLFGVYRTPEANNVELDSPLGMPQFKEALTELMDLDIAYSRNATEIHRSDRIVLLGDELMMKNGQNLKQPRAGIKLPKFVKNVFGSGDEAFYKEINPELNTAQRIEGINNQLDFISYKSGYSPGYFRFNGQTGLVTATQVEADDRRTIQLIKDHRDKLEDCLNGLIYALSKFADLYNLAPATDYDVTYSFGDITYSYEEDKAAWWKYRIQGDVPPWMYYVKFEGMSEDEAKVMVDEAKEKAPALYEEE